MNVTVSLGFSLRFTTRIHFTFSSTARIGHSLRPSSSIRVLRAVSEEGGGNPTRVKGDRRAEKQIRKKTTGNSRVTKETERIQSLGRSLPISALPSPVVPSPEGTAEGGVTVIRREKSGYEGETSQVATGTEEDWDR